jgi:hypothetical protein
MREGHTLARSDHHDRVPTVAYVLLDLGPAVADRPDAIAFATPRGVLEMRDVWFENGDVYELPDWQRAAVIGARQ